MTPAPPRTVARAGRRLTQTDIEGLVAFLARLDANGDGRFFHPHPFTREAVAPLADPAGRDEYHIVPAARDDAVVAYGMLRGWEEGFTVPSLGLAVDPAWRGHGLGRGFLEYLHARALARGARTVRLTVHRANERALSLYTSSGYTFGPPAGDRLVGRLDLGPVPAVIRSRAAA